MISKLMICPYFGDLPEWFPLWEQNTERMRDHGYNFLFDTDEDEFQDRVRDKLGIVCPPMWGGGKIWDYRPALGLLYEEECEGYDFWGHTDFDCVYGRVERWVTDEFLDGLDMHSNCETYVNGCWSLYRNNDLMRNLFKREPMWHPILEEPTPRGWAEKEFSEIIRFAHDEAELVKEWTQWQVFSEADLGKLRMDGDWLLCRGQEVFMAHFRRTKEWPL